MFSISYYIINNNLIMKNKDNKSVEYILTSITILYLYFL